MPAGKSWLKSGSRMRSDLDYDDMDGYFLINGQYSL